MSTEILDHLGNVILDTAHTNMVKAREVKEAFATALSTKNSDDGKAKRSTNLGEGLYGYSASQIDTFRDCPRKWALDKIDGVPRAPNKSAEAGSRIHAKLETYLNTGAIGDPLKDDDVKIMLPGIKHLPKPGKASVEEFFNLELPGLGEMRGFVDAQYVADDGVPVIIDHKTTSDLRWALKHEELMENTQSVIYAVYAMEKYKTDMCRNRWVYYQRNAKKPRSRKVEVEMHLSKVAKLWLPVIGVVKEMKALRDSGVKGSEIEFKATACSKYGGCAYKGTACKLTSTQRLRSMMMNESMKARMKARKAEKVEEVSFDPNELEKSPAQVEELGAPTEEPMVNPPEKAELGKPTDGMSPLARMKAAKAGKKAAMPAAPVETVTKRKSKEKSIQSIPKVKAAPAKKGAAVPGEIQEFEITRGRTINLGDFNSARVDVKIVAQGSAGTLHEMDGWLKGLLADAVAEFE